MVFYDYLFLVSNCAIKHPDGELIIGNNSENADVSLLQWRISQICKTHQANEIM